MDPSGTGVYFVADPRNQLPLPIRLDDYATWANWLSRHETEALEQWLLDASGRHAYICGASGLGKTHLLQACCESVGPQARYVPLRDLKDFAPEQVLADVEQAQLLALDDIDVIAGSVDWQEALFAAYNRCSESGTTWLVTARCAPAQLEEMLPDLASRLASLPVFQLPRFSETEIEALLKLRAVSMGFALSDDVIHFCALRLPRDASSTVRFLERLDRASLAERRAVTVPFIRGLGLLERAEGS